MALLLATWYLLMAKPETRFRNRMRDNLKGDFSVMQIESGDTAPGVPDTHLLLKGTNKTCWVELKVEKERPYKIDLRKTQVPWLRKYWRNGGKCFIALNVEDENVVYIWSGSLAMELYQGANIFFLPYAVFYPRRNGEWRRLSEFLIRGLNHD